MLIFRFTYKTSLIILATCISIYFLLYCYNSNDKFRAIGHLKGEKNNSTSSRNSNLTTDHSIHLLVLFSKANVNQALEKKFSKFMSSLVQHSSVDVTLHIVGDAPSQKIAKQHVTALQYNYKVEMHDLDKIAKQLDEPVRLMQKYFSFKTGSYYSDALFFISLFIHRIFHQNRIIMVDVDVCFLDDIYKLYSEFSKFSQSAIIGIAYEQQPVYQHVFQMYRLKNPNTTIGNAPDQGFPGFNSGVLLLDLDRMRNSSVYNYLLEATVIDEIARKYHFKGHLGDQDFFTLVSINHKQLFHILPCGWNRQLCQWWRHHGYAKTFNSYHKCDEFVSLYHGNCNTLIPVV